ncbi:MAG: DUF4215 domain-containing protein, partial [Polyangia bacterium]|nr:DUF4215 domain-containing protein [Polyangia bacterium]
GSTSCTLCDAGSYQDAAGSSSCIACPAGSYGPTPGQAACLACLAGWVSSAGATACQELCGDGLRVGSEGCDDGNIEPVDGCSELCQVEAGWLCPEPGEACIAGCEIDGTLYTAEQMNPGNECEACRPTVSRSAWSSRVAGTPCAEDLLGCTADRCDGAGACIHPVEDGCLIAGVCITADATDPGNPCAACLPALRRDAYSALAPGVVCPDDGQPYTMDVCDGAGACIHPARRVCVIGGAEYDGGAPNPANPCQACDPGVSQDGWTNRVTGYPCPGDGLDCTWDRCDGAGQCEHQLYVGCLVEGACVADRALEPGAPCRECNPALSVTSYSPRPAGVSCPDDGLGHTLDLCDAQGSCVHPATGTCSIDYAVVEGGAPNPANPCQFCDPLALPSAWSDRVEGYPCVDDGLACTWDRCDGAGVCEHPLATGCLVVGACLGYGALDPANECLWCDPSQDATGFSPRPAGTACADDGLDSTRDTCDGAGACAHDEAGTCSIGGVTFVGGAANPANPCEVCAPAVSTSVWVGQVEGFPCASDGLACTGDVCDAEGACIHPLVTGCLIGGACIALHALDPEDACRWCDPTLSTDSYSVRQGCGLAPDAGLPDGAAPDAGDATDVGRCGPGTHLEDGYCVVDPGGGKGGCDCRAVGEGAGPWSTALLWLGVLLLVFRRRRRAVNQDR